MQYYKHEPSFGVGSELKKDKLMDKLDDSSDTILSMLDTVFNRVKYIDFDTQIVFDDNNSYGKLPSISIEKFMNGQWKTLQINELLSNQTLIDVEQSDLTSSNFLTYIRNTDSGLKWSARWMIPDGYHSTHSHRMVFEFPDTTTIKSIDQSILTQ